MNTKFNPFYTPVGKIRPNGDSIIEYHVFPLVQWVVENHGKNEEKWYSQVVDQKWGVKEYSIREREIESFKAAMEEKAIIEEQLAESRNALEYTSISKAYDGLNDLRDVNLENDNVDLPVAQPLPAGWDIPMRMAQTFFEVPRIEFSYSLSRTHAQKKFQGIDLGLKISF